MTSSHEYRRRKGRLAGRAARSLTAMAVAVTLLSGSAATAFATPAGPGPQSATTTTTPTTTKAPTTTTPQSRTEASDEPAVSEAQTPEIGSPSTARETNGEPSTAEAVPTATPRQTSAWASHPGVAAAPVTPPPSASVDVEMPAREPDKKTKLTGMALVRSQQHALTVPADQLPELPTGFAARSQRIALPAGVTGEDAELAERMAMVTNSNCTFYGLFAVCGAIRDKYNAMGGPASFLGWPTSPEYQNPGNTGARSEFLNGSIYWSAATGAHPVTPLFMTKWAHYGWEAGQLGYPTTDEIPNGDNVGSHQNFQKENAAIYWNSAITGPPGLAVIKGLIRAKWDTVGAQTPGSLLGYPAEDEKPLPDGQGHMSRFERGVIYWHPTYGAHAVTGIILSEWSMSGYELGEYGYPVGAESNEVSWHYQDFQHGRIQYGRAMEDISQPLYDCQLNVEWPKRTYTTNWVRSNIFANCSDPKQKIEMTTKAFWQASGSKSETRKDEKVISVTEPAGQVKNFNQNYYMPCFDGSYRITVEFAITNADGGVMRAKHNTNQQTISGCQTQNQTCPGIPQQDCDAAVATVLYARWFGGTTRPNYAGNEVFENNLGHLPPPSGQWYEYDIYPKQQGVPRDGKRVVLDTGKPVFSPVWFTNDHYQTLGGWTLLEFQP